MTDRDEIAAIKDALRAHKEQIEDAHAQELAVQSLLVGLMNALIARGVDANAIEEAFEYAAQVAMATSDKTGSTQSTRSLQIVDEIREAVVRHKPSSDGV